MEAVSHVLDSGKGRASEGKRGCEVVLAYVP